MLQLWPPLQRRSPETCFYTVLMHSFQFFLKSITFLYNYLNFYLVLDMSCSFPHLQFYAWGETNRTLTCVSSSSGIPLAKPCPLVELPGLAEQGFSIPLPSSISSVKTSNFPVMHKGRNSLHFLYSSFFFSLHLETESSHLNKSLDSWVGD